LDFLHLVEWRAIRAREHLWHKSLAAVTAKATVAFYKTTCVIVIETYYTRVEAIVVQCNTYVQGATSH